MAQIRTENPAANKASRTVQRAVGTSFTAVAATDLCTLVGSPNLDSIDDGALVNVRGVLTGGAGLEVGKEYYLVKYSSTTFRLHPVLRGPALDITSDATSTTQRVTYGLRDDGILTDIV